MLVSTSADSGSGIDTLEMDLLLSCVRLRTCAEVEQRIVSLAQKVTAWDVLVQAALRHGVVAPLYTRLKTLAPDLVPASILDTLRGFTISQLGRNLRLTSELLKIVKLLAGNDVRAVAYKGPVLGQIAYGSPALRSFVDLDILVHRSDFLKCATLLNAAGYNAREGGAEGLSSLMHSKKRKDAAFIRSDIGCVIELHWALFPQIRGIPLSEESVWQRCEEITLSDQKILSLAPEDLVVYLCIHGAKHCWEKLKWICDIAALLHTHSDLDWSRITSEAERLHAGRMVSLGLLLAHELLGAELPDEVWQYAAGEEKVRILAKRVQEWLSDTENDGRRERREGMIFWLEVRERRWDAYAFLVNRALSPRDIDKDLLTLPRPLYFLYYVLRPVRLIFVRAAALVRSASTTAP